MKITCVIVDDEPMALNLVESYVEKTPFLELKKKYSSAIEAMEFVKHEPINLLFLDIQMPDLTGIEFSKMLPKETRVIFTTAFDQYALEGFKVEALDYLLKPFDYAEFLTAANKAQTWFELVNEKHYKGYRLINVDFDVADNAGYIYAFITMKRPNTY